MSPRHLRPRLLGALCALALLAAASGVRGAAIDRIVAVVNDEAVTRVELNEQAAMVARQLQKQGIQLPPRDVLERQVLERMVIDRVQLRFAKETGIRVDDAQLDKALQRIAESNRLSLEGLRQALEQDGVVFARFREEIRNEIMLTRLREREVDNRIVVSEAEVDNFLATQDTQTGQATEFDLAHILLRLPEQASPEQVQARRAQAERALAQLRGGADFGQIAAAFSDAPDALQGGAVGWRPAARLPALYVEALNALRPGELSPVLRSPAGFHIVKLIASRGSAGTAVITQTHARHILIKASELVSETEARHRLAQLRERIENGADFGELARLHSDDPTRGKGGDLGWISPGDTVPEFERAMDALKPGQLSEPVASPFGWHLIQVLERRSQDVSRDRQRLLARQAIRARKADENYQDWLRQLRDQAYVEYRLEER